MELYEILIPTVRRNPVGKNPFYKLKHHRVFDKFARDIAGGLSIFPPIKGQWVCPKGDIYVEKNIPVKICCTAEQIEIIADFVAKHYDQLAVMYWQVSDNVVIKNYS